MQTYLFCFLAGLSGICAHVLFIKLPELKKSSKVANRPFVLSGYFSDEWLALASSVLTILIAMLVIDEIIKWQPFVIDWLKWFFVFIGYTGSSLLQAALGKTADKINQVIDVKTNIADGIQ